MTQLLYILLALLWLICARETEELFLRKFNLVGIGAIIYIVITAVAVVFLLPDATRHLC